MRAQLPDGESSFAFLPKQQASAFQNRTGGVRTREKTCGITHPKQRLGRDHIFLQQTQQIERLLRFRANWISADGQTDGMNREAIGKCNRTSVVDVFWSFLTSFFNSAASVIVPDACACLYGLCLLILRYRLDDSVDRASQRGCLLSLCCQRCGRATFSARGNVGRAARSFPVTLSCGLILSRPVCLAFAIELADSLLFCPQVAS